MKTENLFQGVQFPRDAYCEAFSKDGAARHQWAPVLSALTAEGAAQLGRRRERAGRMRHEDGATFNPFDDLGGKGVPWALDLVPLPISPEEWQTLEAGIAQRASLLERVLADVYGPQTLIRDGGLPPELIYANPNFLHPCHGIAPSGGRYLSFYAVDIYRAADGRFRVLRDWGGAPAGLGYALENRIVLSRSFNRLCQESRAQRLAPFFQAFHRAISRRAAARRSDPDIVILSPGPGSRIYFEQALLSRYLGYPLVESQDLTVRNGEVFLKKLAGLEPVDAMVRYIEDRAGDPFAIRGKDATGVAGLVQAARQGTIELVNPLGSGFVDTPVLTAFLPELCRRLLDQEILLEHHATWWCGSGAGRSYVLDNLDRLAVGPAMEPWDKPSMDPARAVEENPAGFMAREKVLTAAAPVWKENGGDTGYVLMRLFACATEDGFAVMPGGLAITAENMETLLTGVPEMQQSKDIWVISNDPVAPVSLLEGLRTVAEFSRSSDLPSRVADHLLWLGRYLERAEGLVRLLRSVFRRLSGDARPDDLPELPFLINLLHMQNVIPEAFLPPDAGEMAATLREALYRPESVGSLASVLRQIRETARSVRDRLSLDSWRVINRLECMADMPGEDPVEFLDETLFTLNAFSGMSMESMTRGIGWRFMDMGRRVERAINQTNLIRTALPQVCTESRSALEALLEVSECIMTYRARYRTTFQLAPVLDLLLVDEDNPKSLAFQCSRLAAHVGYLPGSSDRRFSTPEDRMALEMLTAVRLLDLKGAECGTAQGGLPGFLESMETRLLGFARQVTAHYLSRVPETSHFSLLQGDSAEP